MVYHRVPFWNPVHIFPKNENFNKPWCEFSESIKKIIWSKFQVSQTIFGPMFQALKVLNSVSSDILSVRDAKFSDLVHYFFQIFSVKLGEHNCRKVIEPDFSWKFLFGQKMGKKGPKKNKNRLFGCVVKFSWNWLINFFW